MASCVLVGDGTHRTRLEVLAEELGIAPRVKFLGAVPHTSLVDVYNSADLLVVPSYSEGLGKVALEGMSCGLPVIGTNVGALPALLGNQRGLVVRSGDSQQLAAAISELLADPVRRKRMGELAREYVLSEHSLTVVRANYLSLLDSISGTRSND